MFFSYKNLSNKINQVLLDLIIFCFSFFAAYFIRLEGFPSGLHLKQFWILLPYIVIARLLIFYAFSVYSIVWRYISISDALLLLRASFPVTLLLLLTRIVLPIELSILKVPYGVIILEFLLVVLGTASIRMIRRSIFESKQREYLETKNHESVKRVFLIGGGCRGQHCIKGIKTTA